MDKDNLKIITDYIIKAITEREEFFVKICIPEMCECIYHFDGDMCNIIIRQECYLSNRITLCISESDKEVNIAIFENTKVIYDAEMEQYKLKYENGFTIIIGIKE
jgi:hypothetical protein